MKTKSSDGNVKHSVFSSIFSWKRDGNFHKKYRDLLNIFNHINDGVIATDKKLKVIHINETAKQILKTNYVDIYQKNLFDEIVFGEYEKNSPSLKEMTDDIRRGDQNKPSSHIYKIKANDNLQFIVMINLYPIYAENGKFNGIILVFKDVSNEIFLNDSMYESESKFRAIFDKSIYGIFILADGIIIDCNQACTSLFKCDKEQIIGMSPADLSPAYQADGRKSIDLARELTALVLSQGTISFEWLHQTCSGKEFIANVSLIHLKFKDENKIFAILQDITERKKTDESLRKSESRYKSMFQNSASMMLIIDPIDGAIIDANLSAIKFYGYTLEEFKNQKIHNINQLNQKEIDTEMEKARHNKVNYFEFKHKIKNGTIKDVAVYSGTILIGDKDFLYSIIHDITDKKKMEMALFEREKDLKLAQQISHLGSWKYTVKTQKFYISEELAIIFDYYGGESNIDFEKFLTYVRRDHRQRINENMEMFATGEKLIDDEFIIVTQKGFEKCIKIHGVLYLDGIGNPEKILGTALDITDLKESEEELRSMTQLIEQSPVAIIQYDKNFKINYVNTAGEELYGYNLHEIYNKGPEIFVESQKIDDKVFETLEREETYRNNEKNITKAGKQIDINLIVSPIFNELEEVIGYMSYIRDISNELKIAEDNKKLEEQVQKAQKLETIGTLAGGIAHDFNNILTPIMGYTDMAKMKIKEGEPLYDDLNEIFKASLRARDLISQMLSFSRSHSDKKMKTYLNFIVNEAVKLLRPSIPATIDIKTDLDKNSEMIFADSSKIHQVIMNLCTNSYHAMEDKGGVLKIKTLMADLSADDVTTYLNIPSGKYIILTVSDSGKGMTKEIKDRMFDPFFTTKEVNKGTGLGLSVVHGIIEDHGGGINVYSEVGVGTTINIYFPVIGEMEKVAKREQITTLRKGIEKIVIVDDDFSVAATLGKMLQSLNYSVKITNTPDKVLALLKTDDEKFDLVITDYTMPGMTGITLAGEIKKIDPQIPIIMVTGNKTNLSEEMQEDAGISDIICKPFIIREISDTLRDIFEKGETDYEIM